MSSHIKCGLNPDLSLNTNPLESDPTIDVEITAAGAISWGGKTQGFINYSEENNRPIGITPTDQNDEVAIQSLCNIMNSL